MPAFCLALPDLLDTESFHSIRQQAQDQYMRGEFQKALESEKEMVRMVEDRYGPLHPLLAQVSVELGEMQRNLGQYREAEKTLKWSLALQEKAFDADDPRLADTLERLAYLYEDLARYSDALYLENRVLPVLEKKGNPVTIASTLMVVGRLEMELGHTEEAKTDLSKAISLLGKNQGDQDLDLVGPLQTRAELSMRLKNWDGAQKDLEKILELNQSRYTGQGKQTADALRALGDFYSRKGEKGNANSYYEQALKVYQKLLMGNTGYSALDTMEKTAAVLRGLGRYSEALDLDTKSMAIESKTFGSIHPRTALCLARISSDEELLGEDEQAKAHREEAREELKAVLGELHPLVRAIDQHP